MNLINILLVSAGIAFLIYNEKFWYTFNKKTPSEFTVTYYPILAYLILLFIIGYTIFLTDIIFLNPKYSFAQLVVSVIFFFGAGFVTIVLNILQKLNTILTAKNKIATDFNQILLNKNQELEQKTLLQQESEKKLNAKHKELQQTLEDFYTMRLSLVKQMEKGKLEEENKRIKERLDELKNSKE